MISIGKLTNPESAVNYLQQAITDSTTDYYSLRGESPGKWDGAAAQHLGLLGQVTPDQLRLLLSGLHPTTGKPLVNKWHSQRIVAFDVTFSAPKSVSLLYAIGNDEVRKAVLEAHDQAVDAVIQYLQNHAGFARMYNPKEQTVFPVAAEMVMPRFVHRTSRPVTDIRTGMTTIDPQLHTHIPIPTWVCRDDGSWSALLSQPLYQHAAAAGAVGQAVMRKHLVETLGIEVEVMSNGTFEVAGINEAMRREFSKRRQQIEVAEAMFGGLDIAGREKANLATREKKPEMPAGPELALEWKERAHRVGLTQKLVTHLLHRVEPKRTFELTEESIGALVGEHGLTQENATFSRRDVVRKLTTLAPDGMTLQQCEWATDQVLASGAVLTLGPKAIDGVNSPLPSTLVHGHTQPNFALRDATQLPLSTGQKAERAPIQMAKVGDRDVVQIARAAASIDGVATPAWSAQHYSRRPEQDYQSPRNTRRDGPGDLRQDTDPPSRLLQQGISEDTDGTQSQRHAQSANPSQRGEQWPQVAELGSSDHGGGEPWEQGKEPSRDRPGHGPSLMARTQIDGVNSPLPIPADALAHAMQAASRPSITLPDGPKSSQPVPTHLVPALAEQTMQLTATGVERGVGENPGRLSPTASLERGAGGNREVSPASDRDESKRVLLTEQRYSTPEMVTLERRMLATSLDRRNTHINQIPEPAVSNALATHKTLTAEQRRMVEAICLSGDGVQLIEGVAGAGKTYALNVVRELYQQSGHPVVGFALAGRAAQTLQEEAAINSHTLARALPYLENEHLTPGTVVIVDEAGMVGSRQLAQLIEITARDNAKLVLCGDSHQLQPIDAGAPFRALGEKLGKVELRQSIRHKEEWEKEALMALREGAVDDAVSAYIEKERVVAAESVMERRRMVVMEAMAAAGRGEDAVVLTQSRNEATAINELTRHVMRLNGELSGPSVEVDGKEFALGDRVICTRNDVRLGVTNGLRGEVVDVTGERLTLRTRSGDILIDGNRYDHLDYGYALTAHKAQGITVDLALVVGSESGSREWAYSVMSRARGETRYFTIAKPPTLETDALNHLRDELALEQRLASAWSPLEAKESTLDYDQQTTERTRHIAR